MVMLGLGVMIRADIFQGQGFVQMGGRAGFTAFDDRPSVYSADGTGAGTVRLSLDVTSDLVGLGGAWYFVNSLGTMFATDGSLAGTRELFQYGNNQSNSGRLVSDGERMWFASITSTTGSEVFVSDGTEGGTALVADIWPGADTSAPSMFVRADDGRIYFLARSGSANNYEIWVLE